MTFSRQNLCSTSIQNLEKHADRVLVLDKGALIEQGSLEELLRQKGGYRVHINNSRPQFIHQG